MFYEDVTVIIPVMVNTDEKYISRTLASIANQTVKSKIIIVTNKQLTWFDSLIEDFLYLKPLIIKTSLCYLGEARNIGVEYVNTKYIAFSDADDLWHKDKIKIQLSFMNQNQCDILGCDHVMIDEEDKKFAFGMSKNIPMPSSWFIKTEILKDIKFDADLKICEDGDWWLRVINKYKIFRLDKVLLLYRVRKSSLSSGSKSKTKKEMLMKLASKFILLRFFILCLTYIPYLINKKKQYIPNNEWQ